jgi:hypothetical protein
VLPLKQSEASLERLKKFQTDMAPGLEKSLSETRKNSWNTQFGKIIYLKIRMVKGIAKRGVTLCPPRSFNRLQSSTIQTKKELRRARKESVIFNIEWLKFRDSQCEVRIASQLFLQLQI